MRRMRRPVCCHTCNVRRAGARLPVAPAPQLRSHAHEVTRRTPSGRAWSCSQSRMPPTAQRMFAAAHPPPLPPHRALTSTEVPWRDPRSTFWPELAAAHSEPCKQTAALPCITRIQTIPRRRTRRTCC